MSNQSFKVKNSLHLTPQAVEPSGLEVGDLWMDIDGNLKRFDGSASQDVGSGGVGSVDIMFAQTLEQAVIGDFTTTGTVAITETPSEVLQGDKSLKITHTGGASVEQIVEVPAKFRNKNVTLSLDVASDALSGNLTLTVTDETNTVTLINAESIQPQEAGQTSVKRSVSFNVPSDCESLKYKFTAVSESGKISFIDNVVIELTQTAKLDTTIEVPVMTEWVDAGTLQITGTTTNPTKGTVAVDKVLVRRNGPNMEVRFEYRQTTAGSAGSGDYLFAIPSSFGAYSGLQIDTTKVSPYSVVEGVGVWTTNNIVGNASFSNSTTNGEGSVIVYDSSKVRLAGVYVSGASPGHGVVGSGHFQISDTVARYTASFSVPILGWEATETQSVSLAQTVLVQESDSQMTWQGFAGRGSTRTRVAYFTNARSMEGSAISWTSDTTNGLEVTILEDGYYDIDIHIPSNVNVSSFVGIGKNLTDFTSALGGTRVTDPSVLKMTYQASDTTTRITANCSWSGPLKAGDKIYPMSDLTPTETPASAFFSIAKSGSLKQLNVSENQKIEIPTSELRMEGASSRGTGSDSAIVRFDNIAKLRGDAFEIVSDGTVGTVITMKKKGKLDVSLNFHSGNNVGDVAITINQVTRTTATAAASEIIATSLHNGTYTPTLNMSGEVHVNIGDKIRVAANGLPTANAKNSLNISFQEQEVSVSVTNVLPQFSESDSSVRVDTANGYGSTATRIRRFSNVRDNLGSAITYTDSATDGASFTINESGLYSLSYTDEFNANSDFGVSLNADASERAANFAAIPKGRKLAVATAATNFSTCSANSVYLQKGDVVRPHSAGSPTGDNENAHFTISKVGKPNVTGVDVTPFAKIEYEVTQESYISAGAFNNANVSGSLTSDSNNGLYSYNATTGVYTMLKRARVNVSYNTRAAGAATVEAEIRIDGSKVVGANTQNSIGYNAVASYSAILEKDQTIAGYSLGSSSVNVIAITATELRDAYQVIGGGVENTYSARIASGATLISESYPFIDTVTSGGTGVYNITFKSGFFPVTPEITPTAESSALPNVPITAAVLQGTASTTGVTIRVSQSGTAINFPFNLQVTRQGSDYRTPSKAIGLPAQRIAYVQRFVAPATSGGTSVAGAWNTVPLSTVTDPSGIGISVASNQFILPAGTYDVSAFSSLRSGDGQVRIRNITDSTTLLVGSETYGSNAGDPGILNGLVEGRFTLAAQKTIELQYRVSVGAAYGLGGMVSNYGENVLTASVRIEKLEE